MYLNKEAEQGHKGVATHKNLWINLCISKYIKCIISGKLRIIFKVHFWHLSILYTYSNIWIPLWEKGVNIDYDIIHIEKTYEYYLVAWKAWILHAGNQNYLFFLFLLLNVKIIFIIIIRRWSGQAVNRHVSRRRLRRRTLCGNVQTLAPRQLLQ